MILRYAVITALALALGACGKSREGTLEIAVMGSASALKESGQRLSPAAQLLRSATHEGLVGFDEQGRVVPALADRWIVTDNGQSYIFRLRDGTWPDGKRITADAAAAAACDSATDGGCVDAFAVVVLVTIRPNADGE